MQKERQQASEGARERGATGIRNGLYDDGDDQKMQEVVLFFTYFVGFTCNNFELQVGESKLSILFISHSLWCIQAPPRVKIEQLMYWETAFGYRRLRIMQKHNFKVT